MYMWKNDRGSHYLKIPFFFFFFFSPSGTGGTPLLSVTGTSILIFCSTLDVDVLGRSVELARVMEPELEVPWGGRRWFCGCKLLEDLPAWFNCPCSCWFANGGAWPNCWLCVPKGGSCCGCIICPGIIDRCFALVLGALPAPGIGMPPLPP